MKKIKLLFIGILIIPLVSMTVGKIELEIKSLLNDKVELKIPSKFEIM